MGCRTFLTTPKEDNSPQWGDDQPIGQRVRQPLILTTHPPRVGLRGAHLYILTWELLVHHDQGPIMQSDLPYMER